MRAQAIEKLALRMCDAVEPLPFREGVSFSNEMSTLINLSAKMRILTDRSNPNAASSVIKEIMNQ